MRHPWFVESRWTALMNICRRRHSAVIPQPGCPVPYVASHHNAKQESFWGRIEGRLMPISKARAR